MMFGEKQVKIAARMYEMRDTAKRLLGEKYAETMKVYGAAIESNANHEGGTSLEAMIRLAKKCSDEPFVVINLSAAYVEMVEPSV